MATLTPQQVAQAWTGAGGPASAVAEAVAYAWIESGYRSDAVSPTGCVGIWQICPPPPNASDPAVNAQAAVGKWKACRGGSFACDWTPYDLGQANPGWAKGYTDGQAAASGAQTSPGSSSPSSSSSSSDAGPFGIGSFGTTVSDAITTASHSLRDTALGVALAALGAAAIGLAVWLMIQNTSVGHAVSGAVKMGGRTAVRAVVRV